MVIWLPNNNIGISVIITCFNRKNYLLESLNSLLNQSINPNSFEIVVTKNFNDDLIDNFLERNKILNIVSNVDGIGPRLIEVINICKYDFICFLEDDDIFYPTKLEKIIKLFAETENLIYIRNEIDVIDKYGNIINEKLYNRNISFTSVNDIEEKYKYIYGYKIPPMCLYFNLSSIAIKKQIVLENMRILSQIRFSFDLALFLYATGSIGKLYFMDEVLTRYRLHDSISVSHETDLDQFIKKREEVNLRFLRDIGIIKRQKFSNIGNIIEGFFYLWLINFSSISSNAKIKSKFFILNHYLRFSFDPFNLTDYIRVFILISSIFSIRISRLFYKMGFEFIR
jgi:glycosyltransferase involved in cell wall biosynthesis